MTLDISQILEASHRFSYGPLEEPAKQIRLVQIRPSQEQHSTVQLVIKQVNLNEYGERSFLKHQEGWKFGNSREEPERQYATEDLENRAALPEFQALSYTWGVAATTNEVYIEAHDRQGWFSVGQNLFGFLMSRRHKIHQSGWLWIDQICINQEDKMEKSYQVSLMAEIYVRAAKVIVWLGPAFDGSDEAMDFIDNVERQMRDFKGTVWDPERDINQIYQEVKVHQQALISITLAPYWSRLWIIQELVLGRDRVFLRLGHKTLHLTSKVRPAYKNAIIECLRKITNVYYGGRHLDQEWWPLGPEPTWYHVYSLATMQECYNIRDKAFGMLGLVDPSCRFHPDYTMTLQNILLSILRAECPNLDNDEGAAWPDIEMTALKWLSVLDRYHESIDIKAIRRFLREEAHPAWRKFSSDCLKEDRKPGLKGFFAYTTDRYWHEPYHRYVGSGPSWLAHIRLWWMFPNAGSRRWHSKWLHRTSNLDAYPGLWLLSEEIMEDLSSKRKARSQIPGR